MILQQADDRVSITKNWFSQYGFHLVDSVDKLRKLVDICIDRGLYSLDLETTGVDNRIYKDEYFEDGKKTRHGTRTIDTVVGICMSFDGQNGYYVPLYHEPEDSNNLNWDQSWDEITRLVNSKAKAIFHNKKFDAEFLMPLVNKEYWRTDEHEDTLLLARVINPIRSSPAGLKPLTKIHFNIDMIELDELFTVEKKEQLERMKKKYNFALLNPKEGLEYGCSDGIFTYKLWFALKDKINSQDLMMYNLEKSFCNVIQKMERHRVHIDIDRVKYLSVECDEKLKETGDIIRKMIELKTGRTGKWDTLNVGSPKQLSSVLITDQEGLLLKPTKVMLGEGYESFNNNNNDDDEEEFEVDSQKQYTLNDVAMKSLDEAYGGKFKIQRDGVVGKNGEIKKESIFELIIEYRHYQKMKGSYIDKLLQSHDKYGDVRPLFNQMGTDTTRMSSKAGEIKNGYSGINFQGIPRDSDDDKPELFKQIRTCIIPRPGYIMVKIDYSGEELRVVTNLSGDPVWINSFLNEDGDVHSITSRSLFEKNDISKDERNRGKRCNFAFIYGGGSGAISRNIGCSIEDGSRHMSNLKKTVPVLMGYVDYQKEYARKHKCVYTSFGRKIPILGIDSPIRGIRSKAERCAINYTIQATSADILKFAMCLLDKKIREMGWDDKVKYVLTVHDEIVFEIKPEYLMDVVRKLDEWMVFPWKLPKAHGREWVVPLMTEPGIDINWKARYDFFKMVDGVVPVPKDMLNGKFIGKLKKDEYLLNGKIYQNVPDFLKDHIHRLDNKETNIDNKETNIDNKETNIDEDVQLDTGGHQIDNNSSCLWSQDDDIQLETSTDDDIQLSMNNNLETSTDDDIQLSMNNNLETSTDDIQLSINDDTKSEKSTDDVKITNKVISLSAVLTRYDGKPSIESDESDESDCIVHRWVFNSVPSELTMRKLHAACILAEGKTPVRILTKNGDILISESENIKIDVNKFMVIVELFGLD